MQRNSELLVVFDLDGTLVNSKNHIGNATNVVREKFGLKKASNSALNQWFGKPPSRFFSELNDLETDQAVKDFRKLLSETKHLVEVMPGTIKLLSYLKSKEVVIGIATTKPTHLANEILSHINLISFFDIVQGSELVQPKPSSDVFLLLESKLVRIPNRKFAIGDRVSDMKASISVGYHSTLLNSFVAEIKDEGFSLSLKRRYNRVSTLHQYETRLRTLLESR